MTGGDERTLTLSNKVLFKLLEELQVEEVVGGEGLFSHHGLHGLDVLPDGVTGVLETQVGGVSDGGASGRECQGRDQDEATTDFQCSHLVYGRKRLQANTLCM